MPKLTVRVVYRLSVRSYVHWVARYFRRGYIRSDGTRVRGHWVHRRGSASAPGSAPTHRSPPPAPAPRSPRTPRKKRSAGVKVAITLSAAGATAAVTIGAITISAPVPSPGSGGALTLQIKADLSQAFTAIAKVGFTYAPARGSDNVVASIGKDCAATATSDVKDFLLRNQCIEYVHSLLTVGAQGVLTQVALTWVQMPTASLGRQYRAIVDTPGTGNPPGQPPQFNGQCSASSQNGSTVWVEQVRPSGHVSADRQILRAMAPETPTPQYVHQHCVG